MTSFFSVLANAKLRIVITFQLLQLTIICSLNWNNLYVAIKDNKDCRVVKNNFSSLFIISYHLGRMPHPLSLPHAIIYKNTNKTTLQLLSGAPPLLASSPGPPATPKKRTWGQGYTPLPDLSSVTVDFHKNYQPVSQYQWLVTKTTCIVYTWITLLLFLWKRKET